MPGRIVNPKYEREIKTLKERMGKLEQDVERLKDKVAKIPPVVTQIEREKEDRGEDDIKRVKVPKGENFDPSILPGSYLKSGESSPLYRRILMVTWRNSTT